MRISDELLSEFDFAYMTAVTIHNRSHETGLRRAIEAVAGDIREQVIQEVHEAVKEKLGVTSRALPIILKVGAGNGE